MEPKHHSKVMIVIVVLIVVVVLGLGVAAVFGKRKVSPQPAVVDTRTDRERLIDEMSAGKSETFDSVTAQEFRASMTAGSAASRTARDRALLIESMSAVEI